MIDTSASINDVWRHPRTESGASAETHERRTLYSCEPHIGQSAIGNQSGALLTRASPLLQSCANERWAKHERCGERLRVETNN